jgi:hypothetical protein
VTIDVSAHGIIRGPSSQLATFIALKRHNAAPYPVNGS